jgi:hypothetical protein
MSWSHVLLHRPAPKVRAAREEASEGKDASSTRALLSNPLCERRLLRYLELVGVGRVVKDGTDV